MVPSLLSLCVCSLRESKVEEAKEGGGGEGARGGGEEGEGGGRGRGR